MNGSVNPTAATATSTPRQPTSPISSSEMRRPSSAMPNRSTRRAANRAPGVISARRPLITFETSIPGSNAATSAEMRGSACEMP